MGFYSSKWCQKDDWILFSTTFMMFAKINSVLAILPMHYHNYNIVVLSITCFSAEDRDLLYWKKPHINMFLSYHNVFSVLRLPQEVATLLKLSTTKQHLPPSPTTKLTKITPLISPCTVWHTMVHSPSCLEPLALILLFSLHSTLA